MSEGFVYFLRAVDGEGPIKIGHSASPETRLIEVMQWSPCPLKIVATVPGDLKLERNIQNCFADSHSHNEWFHASERLLAAVNALARGVPVHEAIDLTDIRGNALGRTQAQTRQRNGTVTGRAAWKAKT